MSRRRLDFVLKASQQMVYEHDRALRYTWVANAVYGASDHALIGARDVDVLDHADEAAALEAAKQHVLETKECLQRTIPITTDGQTRHYALTIAPRYDEQGALVGLRGTMRDRTEAVRREAALNDARAEAEDARRVMSMVLGNASHALLTPLTGMLSLIDALRARKIPEFESPLQRIRKSGKRLQRAIERLLDLSALEAGEAQLQPEALDVRTVVDEAAELLRGRTLDKDLAFSIDLPDTPVRAHLDASAVQRVVRNLMSNAIKYTHTGSVCVSLRAQPDDDILRLTVRDTGQGIPDEFLPSLFEPFTRAGTSSISNGGTGLGMAITKRLVDAMGGSIAVETTVGDGTTFVVHLPTAPHTSTAEA